MDASFAETYLQSIFGTRAAKGEYSVDTTGGGVDARVSQIDNLAEGV